MATILGLAPGTVKGLARLDDPGPAPRPLHGGPQQANMIDVEDKQAGDAIFDFVFG